MALTKVGFHRLPAQVRKTTLRTLSRGLNNLLNVTAGRLPVEEARTRLRQTAVAASRGDLTLRQATLYYLEATLNSPGINPKTLSHLTKQFVLQGQKRELFECILFGGYEKWLNADSDLRAIATDISTEAPVWHIEIARDLFAGTISQDDYKLINRVIDVGQGEAVFADWERGPEKSKEKQALLNQIRRLDTFIPIEEYAQRVKHLTAVAEGRIAPPVNKSLNSPMITDVTDPANIAEVKKAALLALSKLDEITFAAVVGGSAERLHYTDAQGKPLPQATFPFLPISRDNVFKLHADEILALANLYYLTQNGGAHPINLPYFMMTSGVTDTKIMENFADNAFFGLGQTNVAREEQPLVPVVSADGRWLRKGEYELNTKPHGHGDFWTLYFNSAAQAELELDMRNFTLVVQGNNPFVFAHTLEFAGLGMMSNASFGFGVCPREAEAPEGSIVTVEDESGQFSTRNIEYPVMQAFGLSDTADPKTGYSAFPGNLNFIFGQNAALRALIAQNRFPGEIINLQKPQTSLADKKKVKGGRGESQLQGLGQVVTADQPEQIPTIVMNAPRGSDPAGHFEVFKNQPGKPRDTVATCRQYYSDRAARRLILAGVKVDHTLAETSGDQTVPTTDSVIELTPAFANRSDILRSKVSDGSIAQGSTLYLSGFHTQVHNLKLDGDLAIIVENEIGDLRVAKASQAAIRPNPDRAGKYKIDNLTIINEGKTKLLDEHGIWQGDFEENEACHIVIQGNGELEVMPGTVITGNFNLTVHDGEKVTLSPGQDGGVSVRRENIEQPTWKYGIKVNQEPNDPNLFELDEII